MKKKYGFWVAVVLTALIGHGCGQPFSMNIKIKADNLKYSFNTKIADMDIFSVFKSKLVKDQFDIYAFLDNIVKENKSVRSLNLYDMVRYQDGKVQAFLAAIQMDLLESFNPNDYLNEINLKLEEQTINPPPIELPNFTPEKINQIQWFEMGGLFYSIQDIINKTSTPPFDIPMVLQPGPHEIDTSSLDLNLPHFMAWEYEDNHHATLLAPNFDSVVVDSGKVVLTFKIDPTTCVGAILGPDNLPINITTVDLMTVPDASITLKNIRLVGEQSREPIGTPIDSIGNPIVTPLDVKLEAPDFKATIEIDLADKHISSTNSPVFEIGGAASTNASPYTISGFKINVQPQLSSNIPGKDNIELRGATGLKIGSMSPAIPNEVANAIKFDNLPADFINAKIEEGSLTLGITPPKRDPAKPRQSYFDGIKITYNISIEQEPVILDGKTFYGLSNEDGTPWKIETDDASISLYEKNISGKPISVVDTRITIETDPENGASFELFDDDIYHTPNSPNAFTDKVLPVTFNMDMAIKKLKVVRWSSGGGLIAIPEVPQIDFGNIGGSDIANFINHIKFNALTATIDFTKQDKKPGLPEALENRLEFKLFCSDLGFDDRVILQAGKNTFTGHPPDRFYLKDGDKAKVIKPTLTFAPVVMKYPNDDNSVREPDENSGYIELGPLDISDDPDDPTVIDIYGIVSFNFDWESAEININKILEANGGAAFGTLTGEFYLGDLSGAASSMHGLMFHDIDIQMAFGGPEKILDMLKPELTLKAEYLKLKDDANHNNAGENDWEANDMKLVDAATLHTLNGGGLAKVLSSRLDNNGNYKETDLPKIPNMPDPIKNFDKVLAKFPKDLKFSYEMTLPGAEAIEVVYADWFDDDDDSGDEWEDYAVKALLMVKLPLILEAETDDAGFIMNEIFEKDEDGKPVGDLLGRKIVNGKPEDIFQNINIKKVALTIEFGGNIFEEARLHIDSNPELTNRLFGKDGLLLMPKGSKNFTVAINSKDFKIIRENPVYPDVKLTFKEGSKITFPRNPLPTRISFSVSGDYTIPLAFDL